MVCPRCNRPVGENDLYCLNCGKQLKEDDAFFGEFEEEFEFDEDRAAKEDPRPGARSKADLKPSSDLKTAFDAVPADGVRRAHGIYAAILIFLILIACALVYLLFGGKIANCVYASQSGGAKDDPASRADYFTAQLGLVSDDDKDAIESLVRTAAIAASTDYDLDTLLDSTAPPIRESVLQKLIGRYDCATVNDLRDRFREFSQTQSYRFSDLRFEIPDECYDEKLFQETLSRLSETYGVSLTGIDRILSVGVHTEVQDPSGTVQDDYFSYLVGKIGTTWYVLE